MEEILENEVLQEMQLALLSMNKLFLSCLRAAGRKPTEVVILVGSSF